MPLIILFGPDGSGKTSIASEVVKEFKRANKRVVYIKMKSHHLFMYLILKFFQKFGITPTTYSPRVLDYSLRQIFKNSKIFLILEFFNVIIWYLIFVSPRLKRRIILVADRFSPDTIVSFHIISGNIPYVIRKILLSLCRESIVIYVYAHPHILLSRKVDEKLSETYLKYIIMIYNEILKQLAPFVQDLIVINTSYISKDQSIDLVLKLIRKYL
jgi:thymidylate kinase